MNRLAACVNLAFFGPNSWITVLSSARGTHHWVCASDMFSVWRTACAEHFTAPTGVYSTTVHAFCSLANVGCHECQSELAAALLGREDGPDHVGRPGERLS